MNAPDYVHIDYGIQREKSKVAKNEEKKLHNSSVPEGKLMGVELIGVYKSGSINWG